jgi:bifunctional pyridoxal-dependent enzyme with beta-cystathionase and maltose regulon repressor activities
MQGFLKQSDSQKWGSSGKEGSYMLTIADMDLPLHEPFRKAIVSRLNLINNFTYKNPSEQYLSCIADWWQQRYLK